MADLRLERHSAVVEQDLPEIYSYIARGDQTAAERVLDAAEEGFLSSHAIPKAASPSRRAVPG